MGDAWPAVAEGRPRARIAAGLGLDRNTGAVAGAMFLMGLGEELWKRFIPKYLASLGAPVLAIGLYGTTEDLLDAAYQYPGGWVADRYGRRRALLLFVSLAAAGYACFRAAPSWPWIFAGQALAMAWTSMASPTLFAVVGDALPKGRRAVGFAVQSVVRRMPIAIAPVLGGLAIAAWGLGRGIHAGLLVAMALAAVTLATVGTVRLPIVREETPSRLAGVWRSFPSRLRWLLASDILVRTCEGMVDVFVVLFAMNVVGISAPRFGLLVTVQMVTAIASYFAGARIALRFGQGAAVTLTFLAFALYPAAVALAGSFAGLAAASVVGGLREIGEPARKGMIVDFAEPHLRARSVGLYYLIRSTAVTPAAFIGGLLWRSSPALPFFVAAAFGLLGTGLFISAGRMRMTPS
jgi:MFS family permease